MLYLAVFVPPGTTPVCTRFASLRTQYGVSRGNDAALRDRGRVADGQVRMIDSRAASIRLAAFARGFCKGDAIAGGERAHSSS